jgi:hypothetical protein
MSTPTPPGDPAGSGRDNAGPATPRDTFDKPTAASRAKGKEKQKKQRDDRDFDKPDILRGIIQALEEGRTRSDQRMDLMMDAIGRLADRVEEQQQQLDDSRLRGRTRPSIEYSPARTHTEMPAPPPARPFESHLQRTPSLQPPRMTPEASPTPTMYASKTKLTEKIEPLGDGTSPSFRQWRISIRDRFVVNADHYMTEVTKKALIWSTTTGIARSYLEPRYQSDDDDFPSADEMIKTLESYFTTGYETETYRNQFHDMEMGNKDHVNETFAEFTARFRSMAVLGKVSEADWFYYLWDKITPQLREASTSSKHLWNHSFHQMVVSLTSIDLERRRNSDRNAPSRGRKSSATNSQVSAETVPTLLFFRSRIFTKTCRGPSKVLYPSYSTFDSACHQRRLLFVWKGWSFQSPMPRTPYDSYSDPRNRRKPWQ